MAKWLVHSTPDQADSILALRHCEMFLGRTLYTHSASLHPGVCQMLYPYLSNLMLGGIF